MSRKKMITFDSESYLSQFKKKTKKKEEDCFQRMAKLTNVQSETVRGWFRANRIPEVEKTILDVYLESGKKVKKVLPVSKKGKQVTFDEMFPVEKEAVKTPKYKIDEVVDVPDLERKIGQAVIELLDLIKKHREVTHGL